MKLKYYFRTTMFILFMSLFSSQLAIAEAFPCPGAGCPDPIDAPPEKGGHFIN